MLMEITIAATKNEIEMLKWWITQKNVVQRSTLPSV